MNTGISFFGTLLYQSTWAIRPESAEKLLSVAMNIMQGNRNNDFSGNKERNTPKYAGFDDKRGRPVAGHLDESDTFRMGSVHVEGDVAIISVIGTMFKRAADMDAMSATAGVSRVTRLVKEAADDDQVSGIVLVFDTPGGTVDGTEDLARAIRDANEKKRVISFVDGLCASAGFWAASQTEEIFVSGQTSEVGSIGVVMQHINGEGFFTNQGLEITFLTNDDATHKIAAPPTRAISEEEKTEIITKFLNPIGKMFQAAVKEGRGKKLSDDDKVFSGRVFLAKDAKKLGLIDKIGSLQDAVKSARRKRNTSKKTIKVTPNNKKMGIFDKYTKSQSTTTEPVELTPDEANALRASMDKLESDNTTLTQTAETNATEIQSLTEERDSVKADLTEANTKVDTLETEATVAIEKADTQATRITEVEGELVTATKERDALKADKENWGDEATVTADKYNKLAIKYNELAAKAGESKVDPIDPKSEGDNKEGDKDRKHEGRKRSSSIDRI